MIDGDTADDSPADVVDGAVVTKTLTGRRLTVDFDGPQDISLVGPDGLTEDTTAYRLLQDIRLGECYLHTGDTDRVTTALNHLTDAPTDQ